MKNSITTKYQNQVSKNEELDYRNSIPEDFHWKDELMEKMEKENFLYLGEIYDNDNDKYYSCLGGKRYRPKHENKHLDEGHFQGYRFAVHHLTEPGDWVFDPTVGSGTAIIEAINNDRNAIGIELEWPELCQKNIDFQESKNVGICIPGNAKDLLNLVPRDNKFKLVVNGTPYPVIGSKTSDAPERNDPNAPKDYMAEGSFGRLKWGKGYEEMITKMYSDCVELMEDGGYLVTLIKDPTSNKTPFMLQKYIMEWVKNTTGLKDYGFFIHRHTPETMFMRTYNKRKGFEDILIPKYQVGYILKKV